MQTGGHFLVTFYKLPAGDKLIALDALLTLIAVEVVLHLLPYRSWRGALKTPAPGATTPPSTASLQTARRVGRMVAAVARRLPGRPQCLAQALAARHMLKRRGIAAELNLGVSNERAAINAHAWLAVGKLIVTGGPDVSGFSAFGKPA